MPLQITRITWDEAMAKGAASDGADEGLRTAARVILEAANQLVPYETGELIGTGRVDFDLGAKVASVYYDTVYAVRLHQNPKYNFRNGRRGRWLRTSFVQSKPHVLRFFGDALKVSFTRRRRAN